MADQFGELPRLHALPQQVARKQADLAGQVLQRRQVDAMRICLLSWFKRLPLQRKQVALGHDVHQAPLVGHRHMPDAVARHGQRRVLQRVVHGQAVQGALMTSAMGVLSGRWGSVTRPRMSCRVRMPSGAPAASSTITEPTRRSCMCVKRQAAVWRCADQGLTRWQAAQARFQRLLCQRLRPSSPARPCVPAPGTAPRGGSGNRRSGALAAASSCMRASGQAQAGGVFVGGVGGGDRAVAHAAPTGKQIAHAVFKRPAISAMPGAR
jgi:hypothetical protein